MRAITIALTLALATGGLASAGDLKDPIWAQAPDRADWAKAYPADAAKAGISGQVKLKCAAAASGRLQGCTVVEEAPVGHGFGAAALSLTSGMALKPKGADGQPIAGRNLIVPVKFAPDVLLPPATLRNPDWMRRPSGEEFVRYYPANAVDDGRAVLQCIVTTRGLLDSCKVVSETPAGHGYGNAALAMSALFAIRPMTIDGLPVSGGRVSIPIRWIGGPAGGPTLRVASAAPWATAPTIEQVAAAFPKGAIGKIAAGRVILRCGLKPTGNLVNCEAITATPANHGFESAARSLIGDFRVITDPKIDHYRDIRIDVPFDFRDPSTPAPPIEVHNPLWVQRIAASKAGELYPDVALKAGVKEGSATLICGVVHDGSLTDCTVKQETPTGMGFGDTARQIAGFMKMNPWTTEGQPVEGMTIQLPVKMVAPPPEAAPPAPAPAPPK